MSEKERYEAYKIWGNQESIIKAKDEEIKDLRRRLELCAIYDGDKDQHIDKLTLELAYYRKPDLELANKINPAIFLNYLQELHWKEVDSHRDNVFVFQYYEGERLLYQATIPGSHLLGDFRMAMFNAATQVASYLKRDTKQVLVDLVLLSRKQQDTDLCPKGEP